MKRMAGVYRNTDLDMVERHRGLNLREHLSRHHLVCFETVEENWKGCKLFKGSAK